MIIKSNGFWIKHQSKNHEQRPLQRRPNPTGALRALDIVLHPTCIASRACFDLAFWDLQCCKYGVPLKKNAKTTHMKHYWTSTQTQHTPLRIAVLMIFDYEIQQILREKSPFLARKPSMNEGNDVGTLNTSVLLLPLSYWEIWKFP